MTTATPSERRPPAWAPPGAPTGARTRPVRPAISIGARLATWGCFTASWDVVAAVDVAGRTFKLANVLFVASIACCVAGRGAPGHLARPSDRRSRTVRRIVVALAVLLVLRALLAPSVSRSMVAVVGQLGLGPVAFLAVYLHRRHTGRFLWSFAAGMATVCAYAVYEIPARLSGLPRLTGYDGLVAGVPRAAGFAFEPAYLAVPATAAAIIAYLLFPRNRSRRVVVGLCLVGVVLANARVVALELLVFAIGFAATRSRASWGRNAAVRRRWRRAWQAAAGGAAAALLVAPGIISAVAARLASIFDTSEVTSNLPRLELYRLVVDIASDHPFLGIGPGMLGPAIEANGRYPLFEGLPDAAYVANNVWLQALLDGGVLAVGLELALCVAVLRYVRRRRSTAVATIAAAWIGIVAGAGTTVSLFWDTEPWILLACVLGWGASAAPAAGDSRVAQGATRATASSRRAATASQS